VTITVDQTAAAITDPRSLISPALFTRLVTRITEDHPMIRDHAERVMVQALAFLGACALNPGAGLAPSEEVDMGWHTFILYTREYAEFCERVAGRFIHHTPNDETDCGEARSKTVAIDATVSAMRAAGLHVDIDLWLSDGECSQCHAGCHDSPRLV
jgi:hypothetical protein